MSLGLRFRGSRKSGTGGGGTQSVQAAWLLLGLAVERPWLVLGGSFLFSFACVSSLITLQTVWTGFNPRIYSDGSPQQIPLWWKIATAKSFVLSNGIVTDNVCHSSRAWMVQCIPLHQGYCQPGRCPADRLTALQGLTVKAQYLSAHWLTQAPQQLLAQLPTKGGRHKHLAAIVAWLCKKNN